MVHSRKKRKKRIEQFERRGLHHFSVCIWPGILCIVGLLLPNVVGEDVPGVITTTFSASGVLCGDSPPKRCVTHTTCFRRGSCLCQAGTYGDGAFQCYPEDNIRAEIFGTPPTLRTFKNTRAGFHWPCRFRHSEFTTIRKGYGQQKCDFQIFGAGHILGGRIALTGFEVHLRLRKYGIITKGIGIRKEGRVKNNVFTYIERGRNEFVYESPVTDTFNSSHGMEDGSGSGDDGIIDEDDNDDFDWGPPEELDCGDGERVACEIDEDNFATVSVPSCNTDIRFRAPNVDISKQDQSPGLSVTINDKNGPIDFKSPLTYLGDTKSDDILRQSALQKKLPIELQLLDQVMENAARQYSTPEGSECEDTARTYRSYCRTGAQKIAALKSCSFFLVNPNLVSCMDPPGGGPSSKSLNAFKLCLWHSCSPSTSVLNLLKYRVQLSGCTPFTPAEFSQIY